ncbi:uncharacterized protein LOC132753006 [Ruditapes philippinarum]|uniref:uncharacterized protein LOC132753006 n=1 Tax=Ruditapes philippinarum TaxID=129788 RepID=UPI00295C3490|nr:uncharacterized protein LOC132753006 [Ruditapes philippinarum]
MQREEIVVYENTVLNTGTVRIGTDAKRASVEDENCLSDNRLSRIKCLMYTALVMMILMYAAVIGIITTFVIYAPINQVDGNWAQWSDWSSCDVTCGSGSKSRFRTCTKPTPTSNGRFCTGYDTDIATCQLPKCHGRVNDMKSYRSTFSARLTNKVYRPPSFNEHEPVVFDEITYNNMNGYDISSGIFKAPVSGVYLFIYFIEIDGEFGKIELQLNNKSISKTTLSSMYVDISVFSNNNSVVFQSTNINRPDNATVEKISCLRESKHLLTGSSIVGLQQFMDSCPYKGGVRAKGGDSIITYMHAGSQVWIQNAGWRYSYFHSFTSGAFTGILLKED